MNRYKRILVSLSLSDLDPSVISYANLIVQLTKPERLELVSVVSTSNLPPDVVSRYPALVDATAQSNTREIQRMATRHLQAPVGCDVRVHVYRGNPLEEIVNHAKAEDTDLILVGRDPKKDRSGTLPERLSRVGPCSVLVVPKGARPAMGSILVPVDFSVHSGTAVKRAASMGRAARLKSVYCLYVYDIPGNYRRTGISFDEFGTVMKQDAEARWQRFRASLDNRGLELILIHRRGALPTQVIKDEVTQSEFDLVVMGARGQSAARNLLLGTEAQRSINATQAPLLIVRSKREATGMLETLSEVFGQAH